MGNTRIKNARRIFSQFNDYGSLAAAVSILENNEYKITYYEIISGTSGTITPPTGATFNEGEFGSSGNAILSKITIGNKPSFETPLDAGNNPVTVSLNITTGAYVCSGVYTDTDVALIYSINIRAIDYQNLNYFYIIETVLMGGINITTPNAILLSDNSNDLDYIALGANQSIRRNSANTAYEAFTPNKQLFTIMCAGATGTAQLAANTTHYWSVMVYPVSSFRSIVNQALTSLPYNCTLIGATITTWNASGGVSQTNSSLFFRLNGSDNTLSSTVLWNATANSTNVQNVTGLNVSVGAGVTWELKLVMGNLATAPTNAAQCNVILYFERD